MSSTNATADERQTLLPQPSSANLQPEDQPLRMNIATGTALLAQVGAFALLITVWYATLSTDILLASYHPLANSLGLLFLVQAILILQPTHTQAQKKQGAITHGALHSLGVLSFAVGASIIWYNKHLRSAPHYTSLHGKLGLAIVILLLVQATVGIVAFWFPGLLGGESKAKATYKYHRISGYLVSALVLTNVTLGTQTTWFYGKVPALWIWIVYDVLIVVGLAARIRAGKMKVF